MSNQFALSGNGLDLKRVDGGTEFPVATFNQFESSLAAYVRDLLNSQNVKANDLQSEAADTRPPARGTS